MEYQITDFWESYMLGFNEQNVDWCRLKIFVLKINTIFNFFGMFFLKIFGIILKISPLFSPPTHTGKMDP